MVVGPYETVQLASSDPTALTTWLTTNGYAIPADIAPVIAAYVARGLRLPRAQARPGHGRQRHAAGARDARRAPSPTLPLRMVAAGAGATVPITLFVVGEGRYEPTNFPSFTIAASELVWDFSVETSNYAALRQRASRDRRQGLAGRGGPARYRSSQITTTSTTTVQSDPAQSGYADSTGNGAPAAAQADLATLFGGIDMTLALDHPPPRASCRAPP